LEANFVPGAGVLAAGVKFNPSEGYQLGLVTRGLGISQSDGLSKLL
jgi:hypothetical protein